MNKCGRNKKEFKTRLLNEPAQRTITGPLYWRSMRMARYVSRAMSRASATITCEGRDEEEEGEEREKEMKKKK
jgi:hypothetical protein